MSRCPDDAFNVLWQTYFKSKFARLSAHPVANFVLAKALERVSEVQLTEVFDELSSSWNKLIRGSLIYAISLMEIQRYHAGTSRTGVMRAVVDRVCALEALSEKIPDVS